MSALAHASSLLRSGDVVAFPTETVYGLGANALDEASVAKIFAAKGRPAHNPLIIHVSDIEEARGLTSDWTPEAEALALAFWPGPLSLVLKKNSKIPGIVTAGGETVAIRCPDHPVALALLRACKFPLAAPSANRSNYISPSTAAHVIASLDGRIPLVLDGGPCKAGIESTVLSLVTSPAQILRPGPIPAAILERCGIQVALTNPAVDHLGKNIPQSPGQMPVHYAPTTLLLLRHKNEAAETVSSLLLQGKKVGYMRVSAETTFGFDCTEAIMKVENPENNSSPAVVDMPEEPTAYAKQLYAALHLLDSYNLEVIVCEQPPSSPIWAGITDRLNRAATTTN